MCIINWVVQCINFLVIDLIPCINNMNNFRLAEADVAAIEKAQAVAADMAAGMVAGTAVAQEEEALELNIAFKVKDNSY